MCFFSKTKKLKRAIRPIRVYKWLTAYNTSPFFCYDYHKGMNVPKEKIIDVTFKFSYRIFTSGVLHALKQKDRYGIKMYIPIGAKYNDEGVSTCDKDCRREIISTALYWPKNKFEKWWYNLISKKY